MSSFLELPLIQLRDLFSVPGHLAFGRGTIEGGHRTQHSLCRRQVAQDLGVVGESTDFVLAENESAIESDVENASGTFDQLRLNACRFSDCSRQTDGLGGVVSHNTIGDTDLHCLLSLIATNSCQGSIRQGESGEIS